MKRVLISIALTMSLAAIARAESDRVDAESRPQYFQPCQSWNYNSQFNGYVCSFLGIPSRS